MVRGTDARAHRESTLRRVLHHVTASNEALADDDLQRSSPVSYTHLTLPTSALV